MQTKLKISVKYALWAFLLIVIINIPISGLLWIGKHLVALPVNDQLWFVQSHNLFFSLLMVCLIGPFIEEMLFRYPITLERKALLKSFTFGMLLKLVFDLLHKTGPSLQLIILLNLCWVSIILYFVRKEYSFKAQQITGYISVAVFTLLHIANFTNLHWDNFIFALVQVLPLGVLAFFLNKIRIQCGLIYCVGVHIAYNIITFIIMLPTIK